MTTSAKRLQALEARLVASQRCGARGIEQARELVLEQVLRVAATLDPLDPPLPVAEIERMLAAALARLRAATSP